MRSWLTGLAFKPNKKSQIQLRKVKVGMFEEEEEEENDNGGGYRRRRDDHYIQKSARRSENLFVDLKSNDRGRFLKITKDVRGRRDTIMVPEETLQELIDALNNVSDYLKNEGDQD